MIEFFGDREFNCRMTIEQSVKLGKTATETLKMLRDVYGDSSMSRTRVFELHKRFMEGREDVEDDPKSGRPCTSTTDTNIEKVRQLVSSDCHLTIRVLNLTNLTNLKNLTKKRSAPLWLTLWACGRCVPKCCQGS